ncbi:MAG: hypothetical protein WCG26_16670, partial [Chloroflexales bacterium]
DRLETLRISPLEYQDTKPYWSYLLWRPVQPFAVFMILYVLCTTLFAPRWLGKLLWLLRCKRLARFLHQWACWRQRSASPANLAGKACDYAHAVEWRVHRSMTARARSDLLASAERHLRQASVRQPKVDAWLARILFLQGRLEDAERLAKHAVDHRVHHRGRLELARVLIARGKVASAASQLGAVAWWRTLSADAMWLRAIVAFHGGKLSLARRWLFFARRSRVVRRQSALLVAALRERLGQERQAEKAARQAATSGVGVVSASTWLARRARGRSDHADARRWAALGLSRRPGHAPLELEAAFAGDGGLDALVALVKRHARSAPTLAAVLTFAARTGLRHAYLDARLDDDDDAPAALWEARGDYAHAAGDHPRALAAWAQAAKDDESLTILVRLRGRVLTGEALASERPELALELVRAAKLEGPVARQAARRALYAFLERAQRGLPLGAAQTTADAEPEARALFALLQGDAATARALLPDGLAPQLAPLLERERPLCADE